MADLEPLRRAIDRACERGALTREDFGARATEDDLAAIEDEMGLRLPDDFRQFCLAIALTAPVPIADDQTFEIDVEQTGSYDVVALHADARAESVERLQRPFPFTTRWTQVVPENAFGTWLLTQARHEHFDRRTALAGLPSGASPYDGWLELWSELHYCDTWYIAFGLIVTGAARGEIWAEVRGNGPQKWLRLKPVAPSFCAWYAQWLATLEMGTGSV